MVGSLRVWVGLALVLAGCTNGAPRDGTQVDPGSASMPPAPVAMEAYGCHGLETAVNVPAVNVRGDVPPTYRLLEFEGNALLHIGSMECSRWTGWLEDGSSEGPHAITLSWISVSLEVDASTPLREYLLWSAANATDVASFLVAAGLPGDVQPVYVAIAPIGPIVPNPVGGDPAAAYLVSAAVTADPGTGTMAGALPFSPFYPIQPSALTWEHQANATRTIVRFDLLNALSSGAEAGGLVTAPPGSRLAKYLGTDATTAPLVWRSSHLDADITTSAVPQA